MAFYEMVRCNIYFEVGWGGVGCLAGRVVKLTHYERIWSKRIIYPNDPLNMIDSSLWGRRGGGEGGCIHKIRIREVTHTHQRYFMEYNKL